MIIHLFPSGKFDDFFIKFNNIYLNKYDSKIILFGEKDNFTNESYESNVLLLFRSKEVENIIRTIRYLMKADFIVLHSFSNIYMILIFLISKKLRKRTNWIIWGADLYDYNKKHTSLKKRIKNLIKRISTKDFRWVTGLVEGDLDLARAWYKITYDNFLLRYVDIYNNDLIENIKKNIVKNKNDPLRIQIGNSAFPSNQHIEVFNLLYKYKDRDIELYVPLSYGDNEYAARIMQVGKRMFGDKFYPITNIMSLEDYTLFLSRIDIGIFNNDRQQGMGNINKIVYFGAKLYLREGTSMWVHFTEHFKYNIGKIKDIDKIDFEEFSHIDLDVIKENSIKSSMLRDSESIVNQWTYIIDNCISSNSERNSK